MSDRIYYYIICIDEFAKAKSLTQKEAYQYLANFKGLQFLDECYEAEHTLSIDDAIDDLTAICQRNGGGVE